MKRSDDDLIDVVAEVRYQAGRLPGEKSWRELSVQSRDIWRQFVRDGGE